LDNSILSGLREESFHEASGTEGLEVLKVLRYFTMLATGCRIIKKSASPVSLTVVGGDY